MTAADFAANLRAEMARQGLLANAFQLTEALHDKHGGDAESWWGLACSSLDETGEPTEAEVSDLATALGCPVERLTVSREELERRHQEALRQLREQRDRDARWRAQKASEAEAEALRARVAELTNAIMDLVPMGYAGATVEDKLRNYVEDLRKRASEPYQTAEFDALVADKCKAWQKAAAARRAEAKALARVAELEAALKPPSGPP